jgi:predicted thioesterase
MIPVGLKNRFERVITKDMTAIAMHSGALPIFATPILIAFMEEAAQEGIRPYLEPGMASVGTLVNIEHLSPTPEGMLVWAACEVTAVEGRKVTFHVTAGDRFGLIGEGTHERFIIDVERFLKKCNDKQQA